MAVELRSDGEASAVRREIEASGGYVRTGYGYAGSLARRGRLGTSALNVTLSLEAARLVGCRLQARGFLVELGVIDGTAIAFFYRA